MTMPASLPSPQILTERSASFNKSMCTKGSNADSNRDVESSENLASIISSAHHIRHSSLDSSHPSALHPINLNSKFDHLFSTLWLAKASTKVSVDGAKKESSVCSAFDNQPEGGGETQEELILDPHESLLLDAQEESFSTSMSAESKSPRENLDFILWGNAAFCLPEARDMSVCSKAAGLHSQTERLFGEIMKKKKNLVIGNNHQHLHADDGSPGCHARDEGHVHCNKVDQNDNVVTPTPNNGLSSNSSKEVVIGPIEESSKCQSSVGSTLSGCNFSTKSHTQAQNLVEASAQKPLRSSEAQSCCLDFEAQGMEASGSSGGKMPANSLQEECSSKEGNDDDDEVANVSNNKATQIVGCKEVHQDLALASEEIKIRAELELEIEKDLEQEIRTKIYLLSRRLEELHVLKATRHPKEELSETQIEAGSHMPTSFEKVEAIVVKGAPLSISPSSNSPKAMVTIEQSRGDSHADNMPMRPNSALSMKKLPNAEKDGLLNHASWRKFAMASGWPPHAKENGLHLPACDGGLQNMKISKNSIEGLAYEKAKFQLENTPWTVSSSAKKFDWIRTLRSDVACTPRVSLVKKDVEVEASPLLLAGKEPLHGNVSRTLFLEEGLSAPSKKSLLKTEREESFMTTPSLKKSSSKTTGDLVPSTPRVRNMNSGLLTHDTTAIRSVPAKRATIQKPLMGGIHTPGPLHKTTPDSRHARIAATPHIPRIPPQASSSKFGKTEKTTTVDASPSLTGSLKNASPMHAEKVKRSASAPPSIPLRSVNSKDSRSALPKTLPNKQVGSLQHTRASRVAPLPRSATSSQVSKGRTGVLSNSVSKRSSSTPLKPTGTAKGKWY